MSPRELPDFLKAGDPELSLPRLTGIAQMRAMAGVPKPDVYAEGLSREAAEWLRLVREGRIFGGKMLPADYQNSR